MKLKKKMAVIVTMLTLIVMSPFFYAKAQELAVDGIWLDPDSLSIYYDESRTIKAVVSPPHASNKGVDWIVSNPEVVQIVGAGEFDAYGNESITITGIGPGGTIISATTVDGNYTAVGEVQVIMNPIRSVNMDPDVADLVPQEMVLLKTRVLPAEGTIPMVTYQTTNAAVASLFMVPVELIAKHNIRPEDNAVMIVGRQPGDARIIARSVQDNSVSSFTTVTVTAGSAESVEMVADLDDLEVIDEDLVDPDPDLEHTEPEGDLEDVDNGVDEADETAAPADSSGDGPDPLLIGLAALIAVMLAAGFGLYMKKNRHAVPSSAGIKAHRAGAARSESYKQESASSVFSGAVVKGLSGHFAGQIIRLNEGKNIVGRGQAAIISYPESSSNISRKHLVINYDSANNSFLLTDLSSNGTFLSTGEKLQPGQNYSLKPGDRFYLVDENEMFELH